MAPRASAVAATSLPGLRGLGLRRGLLAALEVHAAPACDFLELTPENWLLLGPPLQRRLRALTERYPCRAHGLSLDLGGFRPLDSDFLSALRRFLDDFGVRQHSDHLSFCADQGHVYELMPLPFTEEAVRHVSARIREASDRLDRRLAIENASRYVDPGGELGELDFLCAVLEEADCDLLLDLNNVHVNSVNHGFDPHAFIRALPGRRIAWGHVAGHAVRGPACLIDTHGAEVIPAVWALLQTAYDCHGTFPVVLERDANLPPLEALVEESRRIDECAARVTTAGRPVGAQPKAVRAGFRGDEPVPLERGYGAGRTPAASVAASGPAAPGLVCTLERFAAAVRDPALPIPGGLEPGRFALYRELAANNLDALLVRVFPILRACIGEASWADLRAGFFRDHRPATPYFTRLGGEFVEYLATLAGEPWWAALADWEWLEVEVRHDPAEPGGERVNPTLRLRHVQQAVHRLRADAPTVPVGTSHWLAVYRDTGDAVRFAELTPVTVRLLQCLQASADSDEDELLRGLAEALQWPDAAQFQQAGREIISNLESMAILSRPG